MPEAKGKSTKTENQRLLDEEEQQGRHMAPVRNMGGNRASREACNVREAFCTFFNSPEGMSPVDVVESYAEEEVDKSPDEGSLSSTADAGAAKADTSRSYSADAEDSDNNVGAGDNPNDSGQPSEQSTDQDQSQQPGKRWAIPGANSRKSKDRTVLSVMAEQMREVNALMEAEQSHQRQESAHFETFLRAQQEAEERRFKALQEQSQENNRMFMQLIGNVISTMACPTSQPHMPNWMQGHTAYSMPPMPTQHAIPPNSMPHNSSMLIPPFIHNPLFRPSPPSIPSPSAMPTATSTHSSPPVNQEPDCHHIIPLTITVEEGNDVPKMSFN
ncbi:hypothetical protein KUCAC02_006963 [Chaenocephalus aceratus]|uniref:Uncharacterized protein n=1 Tax=Chaenocephalus aceratus TaxID=36190 RepID=A0ACB9VU21_CHAAC|nr:hypothetical protein KUCAC02_006963 [Chaenocephalus aceratus]